LPALSGNPICVSTRPTLIAHRGRLVSVSAASGSPVYAAAFVRERKIILEAALLSKPRAFRLIVVHELFHFVWPRLSNKLRKEFGGILSGEWQNGARGELGESSDVKKKLFLQTAASETSPAWRDYVCESFCDTAAWLYSGVDDAGIFTLRKRWRERRKAWFEAASNNGPWKC